MKSIFTRVKRGLLYAAGFYNNAGADDVNLFGASALDSFDNLNDTATREILMARARKAYYNSAFCKNGVNAIAAATVGGVISLQVAHGPQEQEIEKRWRDWADSIGLEQKLRSLVIAQVVDGEGFAQIIKDTSVTGAGKVNLVTFDAVRVQSPLCGPLSGYVDGVKVAANGAPVSYRVLKHHPAEALGAGDGGAVEVPARYIVHLFNRDFPEQKRGVTQLQSVLDVFALVERYTRTVVKSAEAVADISLCLKTDGFAQMKGGNQPSISWPRGSVMVLPEGYEAQQLHAEQPTSSYDAYISALLNQLGAGLGVPKILLQNSAERSNYSSARLDLQQFRARCNLIRRDIVTTVLMRLYRVWTSTQGIDGEQYAPVFSFEKYVELDPVKEATAAKTLLDANLTTLAAEYSKRGIDWQDALNQRRREIKELKGLDNDE